MYKVKQTGNRSMSVFATDEEHGYGSSDKTQEEHGYGSSDKTPMKEEHGYGSSDKTHIGGGSVDTGTCMQ